MRDKNYITRSIFIPLAVLWLTVLACKLPFQVPEPPGPPIPVSTEAFDSFKEKITQAADSIREGETVVITFSEEELTSAFTFYLQEQQNTNFSDPQVYLLDGEIQVFGSYLSGDNKVPVRLIFDPSVDDQGTPHIDIVTVDFGRFSAPDALVESVQDGFDHVWTDLVDVAGDRLWVDTINAEDGTLTIQGQVHK